MDLKQPPNAVIAALRPYRIRTTFDRRLASALFMRMAYGEGGQRRLNALLEAAVARRYNPAAGTEMDPDYWRQ